MREAPKETLFVHNIMDNNVFLDKLFGKSHLNIVATLLFPKDPNNKILLASYSINPHINPYPGLAVSFSDNSVFYGGFTRNIQSSDFFEAGRTETNLPEKLYASILERKNTHKSYWHMFWPKFSFLSFKEKISDSSHELRLKKTHSDTKYKIGGIEAQIPSAKLTYSDYHHYQFHNEAHLKPSIADVKSVIIERRKLDISLELLLSGLELHRKIIDERHRIITGEDEESRKKLEYCVDIEILKKKVGLQKIALLKYRLKLNEFRTTFDDNSEMTSSFASKNRKLNANKDEKKDSPSLIPSPDNAKIWKDVKKTKLEQEIQKIIHESKFDKPAIDNFFSSLTKADNIKLEEVYNSLKLKIELDIPLMYKRERDKFKSFIIDNLKKNVPIEIYDEKGQDLIKKADIVKLISDNFEQLTKEHLSSIIEELVQHRDLSMFIDFGVSLVKHGREKRDTFINIFNEISQKFKIKILSHAIASDRYDFIDSLPTPTRLILFGQTLKFALNSKDTNLITNCLKNPNFESNIQGDDGSTMLHLFTEKSDLESVKKLLARGVNYNLKNRDGLTPLDIAVKNCNFTIMKEILKYDKTAESDQKFQATNFLIAVQIGELKRAKQILSQINLEAEQIFVNGIIEKATYIALENHKISNESGLESDYPDFMRTFLKKINIKSGAKIIGDIAGMGDLESVKILLERGVDCGLRGQYGLTPLQNAMKYFHAEVALELSKKQKIPYERLLIDALDGGQTKFFKTLLQKIIETEADSNLIKRSWSTLFIKATEKNNQEIIELLIEKGLDQEGFLMQFSSRIMSYQNDESSLKSMEKLAQTFNSRGATIRKLDFTDIFSSFSLRYLTHQNEKTRAQTRKSFFDRMAKFFSVLTLNNVEEVDFSCKFQRYGRQLELSLVAGFFKSPILCQSLKKLNVSNTNFFKGITPIENFLEKIKNIEELNFSNSDLFVLEERKLLKIQNHLKKEFKFLKKLDLSKNSFNSTSKIGEHFFYNFICEILTSTTITDLNIPHKIYSEEDFKLFSNALKDNNTLQNLVLDSIFDFIPSQEIVLTQILKDNYTLQNLTMQNINDKLRETLDRNKNISKQSKILFGEEENGDLMLGRKIKELNVALQKFLTPEKTQAIVDTVLTNCIFIENIKSSKAPMAMEKISVDEFPEGSEERALITKAVNDFFISLSKKRSAESDLPSSWTRRPAISEPKRSKG